MTCKRIPIDGGVAVVCTRGGDRRVAACSEPGCGRPHTRLCDAPVVRRGKNPSPTCDRKLCDGHAVNLGPERDYCPAHARQAETPTPSKPDPDPQVGLF